MKLCMSSALRQESTQPPRHVAIVGAGMAGAACAQRLLGAGCRVSVFEKSRGAGGRMATRRVNWLDAEGQQHACHFDHGAPAFEAEHPAFLAAALEAAEHSLAARWDEGEGFVACPEQPAWAKHLLQRANLYTQHTVASVWQEQTGWWVQIAEAPTGRLGPFDVMVLAIPAIQAAALISPFRPDWAQQALAVQQQPTWTLMAAGLPPVSMENLAEAPREGAQRHQPAVIRPSTGPLALVIRNDAKPARGTAGKGFTCWVAHATDEWTLAHLEDPAENVRNALLAALEVVLDGHGQAPRAWAHAAVHRWRYALVAPAPTGTEAHEDWSTQPCLWDPTLAVGVAGDAFCGTRARHTGVQRAWLSGTQLAEQVLQSLALHS
jgi:hypothetical protein